MQSSQGDLVFCRFKLSMNRTVSIHCIQETRNQSSYSEGFKSQKVYAGHDKITAGVLKELTPKGMK